MTPANRLGHLTPAMLQCVELTARGMDRKELAAHLGLSTKTIEYHLLGAKRILGVVTDLQMARLAWFAGLGREEISAPLIAEPLPPRAGGRCGSHPGFLPFLPPVAQPARL